MRANDTTEPVRSVTRWPYFSMEGDRMLACPHCGLMLMDDQFMQAVVKVRMECGFVFRINSGYRCPEYNNQISSTGFRGPHTTGRALDIAAASSTARFAIMAAALRQGMRRFGVGSTFIHIDNLAPEDGFPTGLWSY